MGCENACLGRCQFPGRNALIRGNFGLMDEMQLHRSSVTPGMLTGSPGLLGTGLPAAAAGGWTNIIAEASTPDRVSNSGVLSSGMLSSKSAALPTSKASFTERP